MFRSIRQRLLLYYLLALASTLSVFGVAVRLIFEHLQASQIHEQLLTLSQVAIANANLENGQVLVRKEYITTYLDNHGQAIQWFDLQKKMLGSQGKSILNLPLITEQKFIIQSGDPRIQGLTIPILNDKKIIGYIRVSQSLEESDEALHKLDLGLGFGVVTALILSGVGGIWLTQQAMKPIEESFDRLKQFTADAAHELRNPLMAIQSNAEVSLKYPEGMRPDDAESLQAITSATAQMVRLTEDLLLLARTDATADRTVINEKVNVVEILNNLGQLYSASAASQQVTLTIEPILSPIYVSGQTDQLTRLFTNLIVNAMQHTPAGGVITIKAIVNPKNVQIHVIDTGVGITPEHLERLFDRFWRADPSRNYRAEGSGLGLSIVKAIVQNHGGLIMVTSKIGKGSCFTVQLPINI